jgi:MFS family permease
VIRGLTDARLRLLREAPGYRLLFLASAALLLRIRERLEQARAAGERHWRELAAGFSLVVRSRPLLTVLVAWSIVMLANGATRVAEVVLAKDVFGAGDFGYGFLVAMGADGLVVGSISGGDLVDRDGTRMPYGAGIALMAVGFGGAAVSPNVWLAAAFVVVAGAGNGVAVVCNAVLVQRGAPDRLRGRAFAVLMSVGYGVLGAGMVAAGVFTNAYGARAAWLVGAGLCAAGAATGVVRLHRHDDRADTPERTLAHAAPAAVRERG